MKLVELQEIFHVQYGNQFDLNKMRLSYRNDPNSILFVSRSAKNNGVSSYVLKYNDQPPFQKGLITVALGGSSLSSFVQPKKFYTGQNVAVLTSKEKLTIQEKLFYCLAIKSNDYRYSACGREANRTLKYLLVPAVEEIPKWVQSISVTKYDKSNQSFNNDPTPKLDVDNWKYFKLDDIFTLKKGKRLTKANMKQGNTPFIGAIDSNNGYRQFIERDPMHSANTITVNYNGNGVAEAFYQPNPYYCSDDVNVLYPKFEMNKYSALFICSIIRKEKYRFSYGRKWALNRMKESKIKLPINKEGNLDTPFMEEFIKTLNFSKDI